MKILHIMHLEKFIPPFIKFINENFDPNNHLFVIKGKPRSDYGMDLNINNVFWLDGELKIVEFKEYLYKAKKIILHGLWIDEALGLLAIQPWLLKKSYWVMWGGDFYFPEIQSDLRKYIVKNVRNVIAYVDGDVEYIKKYYKADPKRLYKCFMYLSNIFNESKYENCQKIKKDEVWILVGNSAYDTNRHEFAFNKLSKIGLKDSKIIVPLSYGDPEYRDKILKIGKEIFGNNFYPLLDFIPYEDYLNILYNIDIALFAHNRQQGIGNLIQLLGLGKKVYLNPETSQWKLCQNLGIKVYDINRDIDLTMNSEELENNKSIVKEVFSFKNLKAQLREIFDE
jgi:dTDP-N-acetylfucosamine:lipid II N-acetylfucosaminyltransferase